MFRHALVALLGITLVVYVSGHGRLMDPPNRSSVWRVPEFAHLSPPANYNDNELFCGGAGVQHGQNGGRCGECGDAYHLPRPRANEGGGNYARGIIVRNYRKGQTVDIDVDLTTSHKGYFQFRLCDNGRNGVPEEQSCFDRNLLQLEQGGTNFPITGPSGHYYPKVKLPQGVTCSHCVLQWHYVAGNNWGDCGNGTQAPGCGPQETFRGCSDISIQ
ncbi:unnamed protein product [Allacma fusca]|uniref:Chitin-binding type-4 domain-containing protein n=1 Tax=Allacma fusca TaxID=39272 RepID=A0A8J2NUN6_9HEXA|nr:unnamed protein product [Allacma fusca]